MPPTSMARASVSILPTDARTNVSHTMKMHVTGGTYKSPQERWSKLHDVHWQYKIESTENDVESTDDVYGSPAVNNDKVDVIGSLNVPPTVSSIQIFGHESEYGVKGRVANVSITAGMIPSHVGVVDLINLNIGAQLEQSLATYMPTTLTILDVSNTMMTKFPRDMDQFTSIATLIADQNNITHVPASMSMPSVRNMSMGENDMKSFEGHFPNMECLLLHNNSLTAIPPVIFTMKKLRLLNLRYNPLGNATLSLAQFNFLNNLPDLFIDDCFNTNCTSPAMLRNSDTGYMVKVCIKELSSLPTTIESMKTLAPVESESFVGLIVGGVAAVVTVTLVVGLYTWKRRKSSISTPNADHSIDRCQEDDIAKSSDTARTLEESVDSGLLCNDPVMRIHRVEVDDIRDVRQLGAGGFGVVWLVVYRGKQSLASKRLKSSDVDQDQIDKFLDEIRLTASLEHPNIVEFVGVAWTRLTDIQALYEYMENGDLRRWLQDTDPSIRWPPRKLQIALDIARAVVYVHSFSPPVIHRDLKSSNVLLDANMMAKLCDFGVARLQSTQQAMTLGVGTSLWLAPEVITGEGDYGCRADVYSFGVVLSELDTHRIPYEAVQTDSCDRLPDIAIIHQVSSGTLKPSFSDSCPSEVKKLALRCLAFDPAQRPKALEISFELSRMMTNALQNVPVLET